MAGCSSLWWAEAGCGRAQQAVAGIWRWPVVGGDVALLRKTPSESNDGLGCGSLWRDI
jgi:hypothetical protein